MAHNLLSVFVKSMEATLFEGKAKAVSCINAQGPFDVLPEHENFISIIKQKVTVYPDLASPFTARNLAGEKQMPHDGKIEFPIDSAILKIQKNQIAIFVGITKIG